MFKTAILFLLISPMSAQYDILSFHGNLAECDTMSRGIYLVWWDKDYNPDAGVDIMLDTMMSYREKCLDKLNMLDPPNTEDGHFYNVYLHNPGDDNDIFKPYGWGNGQGTDANGYPFLTLPIGLINDWPNTAHETFHIFQYNSNSPGYAYSGDSQWYIEASANWFAARVNPTHTRRFIEAESLVRVPHVPMWLSFDNFPADYPQNWQRYVHQYAGALWLYYLTDIAGVPETIITEGFFNGTTQLPQEYLYHFLADGKGGSAMPQLYVDFAARMTNHFDFLPPEQVAANEKEWDDYADPLDDNEFVEIFDNSDNINYRPSDNVVTTAWSFNVYKLPPQELGWNYHFQLNGDATGSEGDPSVFKAKILIENSKHGSRFINMPMENAYQGWVAIEHAIGDTAIYLIIASVPEIFQDVNSAFQTFSYEIEILAFVTATEDLPKINTTKVIQRFNLLGQVVEEDYPGVQVLLYDDRSVKKVMRTHHDR